VTFSDGSFTADGGGHGVWTGMCGGFCHVFFLNLLIGWIGKMVSGSNDKKRINKSDREKGQEQEKTGQRSTCA